MEILLLWVIFGIAAAAVAGSKGRSGLGWLIVGLLFGPLALLFALVAPTNQAQLDRAAVQDGRLRKCPFCAETIQADAIKCKHCGSDLPPNDDRARR